MQKVSTIAEKLDDEEVIELVEHLQPVRSVIQNTEFPKFMTIRRYTFPLQSQKKRKIVNYYGNVLKT